MKYSFLTEQQKELLKDSTKTNLEISKQLNCGIATVSRWRKNLGINIPKGFKKGKTKPWQLKQKEICCPTCSKLFNVAISSNQKFCSRVCLHLNEEYKTKLKSVDRSYMQTEKYKKTLLKDDTPAYRRYRNKVTKLTEKTYIMHKEKINPNNHTRSVAGMEGAYHLDHIISCRFGFDNNIAPEVISDVNNLQMLPWRDNVMKGKN